MLSALWGLNSILNFRYCHLRPVKEATLPDLGVNEIARETWGGTQGGTSRPVPQVHPGRNGRVSAVSSFCFTPGLGTYSHSKTLFFINVSFLFLNKFILNLDLKRILGRKTMMDEISLKNINGNNTSSSKYDISEGEH